LLQRLRAGHRTSLPQEFNLTISISQWQKLTNLQRFVLIKLSHPSHENKNFLPALKEFNIEYSNP